MLSKMLAPKLDLAALILRFGLAAIFIVHGYFKVIQFYPLREEMSLELQTAVGWGELIFGLMLAVGLLSRIAALGLIPLQIGAVVLITGKHAMEGLTIRATGADYAKVGPEFNLVLIAMCLAVALLGGGAVSLDHFLWKMWQQRKGVAPTTRGPVPIADSPAPTAAPTPAGASVK